MPITKIIVNLKSTKHMNIISSVRNYIITTTGRLFPKLIIDLRFKKHFGKHMNWEHPRDINEKIQWLKFNSDISQWSLLADKYEVRKFVTERIGEEYLVPLYGVWESPEQVEFSLLPDSFVLKSNNGAGSVLIVKDKSKLNLNEVRTTMKEWMKSEFGIAEVEPHYSKINKKIIAEGLLESPDFGLSSSIVDYKIWCFNGTVFGTWCCYNRTGFSADTEWHDLDWNYKPEWSVFTDHYRNGKGMIPKPQNYEKMLEIASTLSKGFPEVRVDLYNVNGKIYFGEMTFTCAGGYINFYSKEILDQLGHLTVIKSQNKQL